MEGWAVCPVLAPRRQTQCDSHRKEISPDGEPPWGPLDPSFLKGRKEGLTGSPIKAAKDIK